MKFVYQIFVNDHYVATYGSMKKAKEIFNICCAVVDIAFSAPIPPVVIRVVGVNEFNSESEVCSDEV